MKVQSCLFAGLLLVSAAVGAVDHVVPRSVQSEYLTEADRKIAAGRILLKWGGYVEKVKGQNRKAWAASLWPSLANSDLDNLRKALHAVTYEGMRNSLLGQGPGDDQIVDALARINPADVRSGRAVKAIGDSVKDLVFTALTPCRIADTRVAGTPMVANTTRNLDASNVSGNFSAQGGSASNCGIPANPAALAISVTGLNNQTTGYIRVIPFDGANSEGSPVPLSAINTTATNDMIVRSCQGCTQELKVFSSANTHFAAFVTGYFSAPKAVELSCLTPGPVPWPVPGGSPQTVGSYVCPSGYSVTGGSCGSPLSSNPLKVLGAQFEGTSMHCLYENTSGAEIYGYMYPVCCRVPGS